MDAMNESPGNARQRPRQMTINRERAVSHANPLEIIGRSPFARQRSVPREYTLVALLDPLEVHVLTRVVQ